MWVGHSCPTIGLISPSFVRFHQLPEHRPSRFEPMLQPQHRHRDHHRFRPCQPHHTNPSSASRSSDRHNGVVQIHDSIVLDKLRTWSRLIACGGPQAWIGIGRMGDRAPQALREVEGSGRVKLDITLSGSCRTFIRGPLSIFACENRPFCQRETGRSSRKWRTVPTCYIRGSGAEVLAHNSDSSWLRFLAMRMSLAPPTFMRAGGF
jgi:hypothetical protein